MSVLAALPYCQKPAPIIFPGITWPFDAGTDLPVMHTVYSSICDSVGKSNVKCKTYFDATRPPHSLARELQPNFGKNALSTATAVITARAR